MSEHVVQIHSNPRLLIDAVSRFAGEGLREQEAVILIGTASNRAAVREALAGASLNLEGAVASGRLTLLDVEATLASCLSAGMPQWPLFQETLGPVVARAKAATDRPVRIWGEMANVLWSKQQAVAAIRLEDMWNDLGARYPFSLFCTYVMDPLTCSSQEGSLIERMVGTHTSCQPDNECERLAAAIDQAMEEVLGPASSNIVRVMVRVGSGASKLPEVQALVVWLREHMPRVSERVLAISREIYEGRPGALRGDPALTV